MRRKPPAWWTYDLAAVRLAKLFGIRRPTDPRELPAYRRRVRAFLEGAGR